MRPTNNFNTIPAGRPLPLWLNALCALLLVTACLWPQHASALPGDDDAATVRMRGVVPGANSSNTPILRFAAASESLDDYDAMPVQAIGDPLEPWNRFWFHFNDIFYIHIAKPVYTGYTFVMPNEFQSGIRNFFSNLLFPMRFVNFLLQGNPQAAGVEFGRFFVNTTVGLGGFIDAAKGRKAVVQIHPDDANFGQTLGVWGIGPGCYMVWPFFGPSSIRDGVGLLGDWALDPTFYIQPWYAATGAATGLRLNNLGDVLPMYEGIRDVAVDPYIAMREAYASFRQLQITRGK